MNAVDIARLQYDNRSLSAPKPASGAAAAMRTASGKPSIDKGSKLYEQAQEFESLFVKMMLSEMKKTVNKAGLMDGGMAEDIFSDMLYDEYAKSMSKNAGLGLADQVYLQLTDYGRAKPA
jgi:peptidoglycan hydrolase FlgJ